MTEQELFDLAVGKVLAQGGPSYVLASKEGIQCRYRGPGGRKCLVGWLIEDSEYTPLMEGAKPDVAIMHTDRGVMNHPLMKHVGFLRGLQVIHDRSCLAGDIDGGMRGATDAEFWVEFKDRAREFAEQRGLSSAVLDRVDALLAHAPQPALEAAA